MEANKTNSFFSIDSILRDLYVISGFRISLHDTNFNEIASYPEELSGFCKLVQQNPKAKMHCLFTDSDAFERVRHSGKPYLYKCRFGLCEAAIPLFHNGILSGYIMMGQLLEKAAGTKQKALSEALPYVSSEDNLRACLDALPEKSEDEIRAFANIAAVCADHLVSAGLITSPPGENLTTLTIKFINRNISKKITVSDMSASFNCSKSTLMKNFKKECGTTIARYITEQRTALAKELLQYTELTVCEISEKCGYADQGYFSRSFAKETGSSPTAFRRDPFRK